MHARLGRGKAIRVIVNAKAYRLAAGHLQPGAGDAAAGERGRARGELRRLRSETGKWEKVSLLLPDSWFRINIVELPSLPERDADAMDVVRWSLKKTLPIPPEQLRITYSVLSRSAGRAPRCW